MQFVVNESNRILIYGKKIPNATHDVQLDDDSYRILQVYFSTHECLLIDNKVVCGDMLDLTPSEQEVMAAKRSDRQKLLVAFDKWEKAVLRGREEDSEEIMQWFNALLDLEDEAFVTIPERVNYYR